MQMFGKSCLCQATAKTLQLLYTKTIFLMKRFTFVPDFVGLAKTVAFEYNTHAHTHTHARTHAHTHRHTDAHTHFKNKMSEKSPAIGVNKENMDLELITTN